MNLWLAGAVMGLLGTVAMDLWAIFLNRTFDIPGPNWRNVGRWVNHLGRGRVFHDDIGAADVTANEPASGWALHYGVGIAYGIIFAVAAGAAWFADPDLVPLMVFAWITIAAGWFLLHPGLGLGWALSKTATPWKGRAMGLVAHTVFGLGMWIGALLMIAAA